MLFGLLLHARRSTRSRAIWHATARPRCSGALLVAANPLAIRMSAVVMVDSIFPALVTLAFAAAAWRPRDPGRERGPLVDLGAGALIGLAFLVRAQAL
jgi:4-amino-4-deoxy-L-arabinose transferase-like glycosyltransferase